VGAVLYLVVGVAGTALCVAGLLTTAGRLLAHRPVLELDEHGVRLPAPWPWPRSRDRFVPWTDTAAVVLWSGATPRGRRATADRLAFLPTRETAEQAPSPPSAELLALRLDELELDGLPAVATARWATTISPGWRPGVDEVLAEIRRHDLRTADLRTP
jgi:hypothetical protein